MYVCGVSMYVTICGHCVYLYVLHAVYYVCLCGICVTICAFVHVCFLDLVAHIAISLCAFSGRLSLPSNSLKVLRRYVRKDWWEKLGKGNSSRNVNVVGAQMTLPCISYEWCSQLVGEGHVLASLCMFSNLLDSGPVKHLQSASLWKSRLTIPSTFTFFLNQVCDTWGIHLCF